MDWFVYLLRLSDGSFYCGIAKDVPARMEKHAAGKGSKYVRSRLPILELIATSPAMDKSDALRLEHRVKRTRKGLKARVVERGLV
jgi:putative endonuclease